MCEEFGEAMENDYQLAPRRFLQSIRRWGKQCFTNSQQHSGGGVLLTSTVDVVGQWKEYFGDLLNPTNASSIEDAEPADF